MGWHRGLASWAGVARTLLYNSLIYYLMPSDYLLLYIVVLFYFLSWLLLLFSVLIILLY